MGGICSTCLKSETDTINDKGFSSSPTAPVVNTPLVCGNVSASSVPATGGGRSGEFLERGETDELLSQSPLHFTNINSCSAEPNDPTRVGSFKKSLQLLTGPAMNNTMGDSISIAKDTSHQVSDNTLNALFEEYKDAQEDAILTDGIERLCNDLGYRPDDFTILVLAWRLEASQMCRFTKAEFIQGLQTMNADTIDEIRRRLEEIVAKLKTDSDMFKQLYRFTFIFGLESGNRIVLLDMAIILWRLVFTVQTPPILNRWLHFLEKHPNIRGVPKDTWNMFLNFAETCDITSYDDTEAWPSLFDDFVEYERDRANQNVIEDDEQPGGAIAEQNMQPCHKDGYAAIATSTTKEL